MRLIDADVLIEQMDAEPEGGYYSPHDVISLLMTQPVVEERKTGQWIDNGMHGDYEWELDGRGNWWHEWICSECGDWNKSATHFCPNCGADMKGAE